MRDAVVKGGVNLNWLILKVLSCMANVAPVLGSKSTSRSCFTTYISSYVKVDGVAKPDRGASPNLGWRHRSGVC